MVEIQVTNSPPGLLRGDQHADAIGLSVIKERSFRREDRFAAGLQRWRGLGLAVLMLAALGAKAAPATTATVRSPDRVYGTLFADVQRARVFPDQKTFPDCVPRGEPASIVAAYEAALRTGQPVDLKAFVREHFLVPETRELALPPAPTLEAHLHQLWDALRRAPDKTVAGSSLLPLPNSYVIPGGRFREVYYWDSYFTMLGLRASGREALIESMVDNFAYLIERYGFIPNGNRSYYLSRSQPPFFAPMVELLAERKGDEVYRRLRDALQAEYAYWMDETFPTRHVVALPDGSRLNRYYDQQDAPRPEAFALDEATRQAAGAGTAGVYRQLRSAAESGWDFSSRWLGDGRSLATIETTELVPVDLNCLLYRLELTLAKAWRVTGDETRAKSLEEAAERRKRAVLQACWSEAQGFFFDFHHGRGQRAAACTLAGVAPLFFRLATPDQAAAVAKTLRERFLRPGGVVTSLSETGQQWDAPNGWAPLEWMTIQGLRNYGHDDLAEEIARRWIKLNRDVYRRTGKMMEKYNVEDLTLPAGGGEYPSQDGFGWTNGVLLKLLRLYPDEGTRTNIER